jgi:hypothetical protein
MLSAALTYLASQFRAPNAAEMLEDLLASDSDLDCDNIKTLIPMFKQIIADRS